MPTVIPVKFAYSAYDLWFDPKATGAQAADHVIVKTERGVEIGLATRDAFEVTPEELGDTTASGRLAPVLRVATASDLEQADNLAIKGEQALPTFRRLVDKSGLDMKPVGVEYLFDGEKVVCYFSAEERVDFRQLVRDLSHELRARIDMRQIGVREEAAIVGGYAHCGQELCCARFGNQFEPVSIRMAKEQDLPLNSTKISGACGRLMCCLRYEFEAYRDFKQRAPKKNAVIDTPLGKAKIVEYDTPKEQLCLRLESGKQIRVPLAEMEASPAACKKSEDLGCPCRPDTVLRSTLDKILTPEIQMALAELDRKNGVLPQETFDESDLFVETSRKRRRKSNKAKDAEKNAAPDDSQASGESRRTRRRGKAAVAADGANDAGGEGEPKPKAKRRRTRRPSQASQQSDERRDQRAAEAADAPANGTRRRRHHRADGTAADAGKAVGSNGSAKSDASGKANNPGKSGEPKQQHGMRRRRRPGDKGGNGNGNSAPKQDNAQRGQGHQAPAPSQGNSKPESAGGAAPKRRRRHRGGRGRGKGGNGGAAGQGGNGGAPSAE